MPEHHCPLAWELIELARSAEDMQILYLLAEVGWTYETHRRRAGLVTLLSRDWLDTLPPIPEADPRCPQCGTA